VHLVSLETLEEMPADTLEIVEGDEEGIQRMNGWGPVEIERDPAGNVTGVVFRRCVRVYDEARRFNPIYDDNDRRTIACDTVLIAAGQTTDLSFLEHGGTDIAEARPGWPKVDSGTLATTASGVFVAGDLAHGTRLLIDAVASGKKAARAVYQFITGKKIRSESLEAVFPLDGYRRELGYEAIRRTPVRSLPAEERLASAGAVVELGYNEEEARREASRCLDCGVTPVFDASRCVLCGGCADVCPTRCLKLVPLEAIDGGGAFDAAVQNSLGADADRSNNSAILKDEDRCIRCALCAMRCPVDAIAMERVTFQTNWSET
jgi:ferredoxin